MKTNLITMLTALSLVAGVGANLAVAADNWIEAKVPFAFYLGNQKLPAGSYSASLGSSMLTLRNKETGAGRIAITTTASGTSKTRAKLVFQKVGDVYFLHQVFAGGGNGSQLPSSKVRRELLANRQASDTVTVAAE